MYSGSFDTSRLCEDREKWQQRAVWLAEQSLALGLGHHTTPPMHWVRCSPRVGTFLLWTRRFNGPWGRQKNSNNMKWSWPPRCHPEQEQFSGKAGKRERELVFVAHDKCFVWQFWEQPSLHPCVKSLRACRVANRIWWQQMIKQNDSGWMSSVVCKIIAKKCFFSISIDAALLAATQHRSEW